MGCLGWIILALLLAVAVVLGAALALAGAAAWLIALAAAVWHLTRTLYLRLRLTDHPRLPRPPS